MKKILISTLLALVLLSLSGCFQRKETTEVITPTEEVNVEKVNVEETINETYKYQNKEESFSLQVPAEWTFKENVFGSLVMFFAPQEENDTTKENLGIVMNKLEGDVQLESYYQLTRGNLENVIPNFELVNETKGEKTITFVYKGKQGETTLQRQQTLRLEGTTVYIFTYTALEDTFNDLLNDINNIINSFSL